MNLLRSSRTVPNEAFQQAQLGHHGIGLGWHVKQSNGYISLNTLRTHNQAI